MASDISKGESASLAKRKPSPAGAYLETLKKGPGREAQRTALEIMAAMLTDGRADYLSVNWAALSYLETSTIRNRLEAAYSPATANRFLCALRRTLKEAWRLELMSAENYQRAADLQPVKGTTLPAGRELSHGEIQALMSDCEADKGPAGARDAAIIGLMYTGGPRRDEVVQLDLKDYDRESGQLKVLHGKRNKQRTIYLINGAFDAMADWLDLRGSKPGPLFVAINRGGKIDKDYKQLTSQAIYNMLASRAKSASVKGFSPHDLRRSFVSDLLAEGADIAIVAKMAGHESVSTTARYDRRPEAAKQKAASLLHIPYKKRHF